jgi:hypothetical protein
MTEKGEQGMVNRFPLGRLRGKGRRKSNRSAHHCCLVLIPSSPSLADAVGLGKTTEEGMLWQALAACV